MLYKPRGEHRHRCKCHGCLSVRCCSPRMAPQVPLAPEVAVTFSLFRVDNDLEHYLLGDLLGLSIFSPLEGRQDQTPVFSGSENREVRAGRHHQEGLPAPCGQVNTAGREGRDSGWRTPDSAGAMLRGQSDSCTYDMSLHSRGRRTPVCSASLGRRHHFSDLL